MIKLNEKFLERYVDKSLFDKKLNIALENLEKLLSYKGEGSEMTDWLNYDNYLHDDLLDNIQISARRLINISDYIVSIGIGGSYLGIKALLEPFPGNKKIIFAGNNLSSIYLEQILEKLEGKDFSIIVISKSGTTTEPSLVFRILLQKLVKKYGEDSIKNRVVLITDKEKGALQRIKQKYQCDHFIIPDAIGGRFSIFTPVGLYPFAAAGHDIKKIAKVVKDSLKSYSIKSKENPALRYATIRNILYNTGKYHIETLISYEEQLRYLLEWWKQLFGESEGKNKKGLFPASTIFTTDLHSIGQYMQEGPRNFFETILDFEKEPFSQKIPFFDDDFDGFNVCTEMDINSVNRIALKATALAHYDGDCPIVLLNLETLDMYSICELFVFFFYSCAISGYMLEINPFNQPGVELYKKNMLALLGKEKDINKRKELESKISQFF